MASVQEHLEKVGAHSNEFWFLGNDLNDLVVLKNCAVSLSPSDGVPEVLRAVDVVLTTPGGCGVLAEITRALLAERSHPALDGRF